MKKTATKQSRNELVRIYGGVAAGVLLYISFVCTIKNYDFWMVGIAALALVTGIGIAWVAERVLY